MAPRSSGRNSAPTAPSPTVTATGRKADAAFAKASNVTPHRVRNNRLVANYMETRAAFGEWKPDEDRFVLTTGSQGVHSMQKILAERVPYPEKAAARASRLMSAAVSGTKIFTYRGIRALVMEAAKRLGRPVEMGGRPQ